MTRHMVNFDQHRAGMDQVDLDQVVLELDDDSVWDRVRSLAPSSAPVPGRLFNATSKRTTARVDADKGGAVAEADVATLPVARAERSVADIWADLSPAIEEIGPQSESLIATEDDDPVVQSIDLLRSRLIQALRKNNWSRVAIVSPEGGSGSTFLASNLAARLSQVSLCRTVLMDMNLRAPGVAKTFGLEAQTDAHDTLTGIVPISEGLTRFNKHLALGLADQSSFSSIETLSDPRTSSTLEQIETTLRPDIMLFDMPAMLTFPDMTSFLPNVDAILIVADATRTSAAQIAECERAISGQANLLGVVLNKVPAARTKKWFKRK